MTTVDELLAATLPNLSGAEVADLAGLGSPRRFDPDDRLFAMDEPAETFHIVRSGLVAIEVETPSGGPLTIDTVEPGDLVGMSWLLPPYRWVFSARAVETTETVAFDATTVLDRCQRDPVLRADVNRWFAEVTHRRLVAARFRLLDLYGADR